MRLTKFWNQNIFMITMITMGAVAGAVIWVFFFVMTSGIKLLWE